MGPSVLHVTQTTHAGVPRCVLDLASDQVRRGWRVTVASPATDGFPGLVRATGAEHRVWKASREPGLSTLSELGGLRRIVRSVDPDLVHLHSSKAGLVGRLVVRGRRPTVFQPNGWSFLAVDGARRRAALAWERMAARWTTTLVCVSRREHEDGIDALVSVNPRVVPNAVDLSRFGPTARAEARTRLGLAEGPLVVCVARLSRQKGQDVLLDAWAQVRSAVPGARVVLVGDGPDRAQLEARAAAREDVTFVGTRDDVSSWLAAADVVVLPSRWEGMSYVMLEAMAGRRSVVATDVGGAAEAVGEGDGESAGAVVASEAPDALARAVVERLRHPELAAAEGKVGAERARQRYDLSHWQETMAELTLETVAIRRLRRQGSGRAP